MSLKSLDPDVRFDKQKAGIRANKYVTRYGLRLMTELSAHRFRRSVPWRRISAKFRFCSTLGWLGPFDVDVNTPASHLKKRINFFSPISNKSAAQLLNPALMRCSAL